jgi:hypothetical protein
MLAGEVIDPFDHDGHPPFGLERPSRIRALSPERAKAPHRRLELLLRVSGIARAARTRRLAQPDKLLELGRLDRVTVRARWAEGELRVGSVDPEQQQSVHERRLGRRVDELGLEACADRGSIPSGPRDGRQEDQPGQIRERPSK